MPKQHCAVPDCNKLIRHVDEIIGKCRCGKTHCTTHRLSFHHDCQHDYSIDRDKFITANKCVPLKV